MSEEFGSDFITIVDDDGAEFELEVLDTMDYKGQSFVAFLPANMDEEDPDYGIIILRSVFDENGDELFESIDDDEELQDVYEHFARILFDDEDED
ncbi:MAG: DUF1292 domain-containing protein [Oscillospiraceae bacterium]|jgi:uncharacterized protein YrzB (UPF0473 family)|nr:DUF1292 domain-containing protein [Oscillospiraceae bacterium]